VRSQYPDREGGFAYQWTWIKLPYPVHRRHKNVANQTCNSPDASRWCAPVRPAPIHASLPDRVSRSDVPKGAHNIANCAEVSHAAPCCRGRPRKAAPFKHFVIEAKALTIPEQELDPLSCMQACASYVLDGQWVTPAPAEGKHCATGRDRTQDMPHVSADRPAMPFLISLARQCIASRRRRASGTKQCHERG